MLKVIMLIGVSSLISDGISQSAIDVLGSREVELNNPELGIRQAEGSGGLVYFNGQKFVWIHQGD